MVSIMAMYNIKTSIIIKSTPEKVWGVLTDFKKYANWNPFIRSIKGEMNVGKNIQIELGGMKFQPKLLAYQKKKELRWIGKLLFKGLFDGEHSFLINDNNDGTVTFRQEETFNGILVGLFRKKLETETKQGFESMNQKLKEIVER